MLAVMKPDFAGSEFAGLDPFRGEHADTVDIVRRVRRHHADLHALAQRPLAHPHEGHHAEIGVVPGIHQQGLEWCCRVTRFRRGQALDQCFQHVDDTIAGLGGNLQGLFGIEADHLFDLRADTVRLRRRQVDLVQHWDDLMIRVDREIGVGQGLRFHTLARIDQQQRAFARGETAADFIGKIDMTRRIHQVQRIHLAVGRLVLQAHGLRLDGDAAFPLELHRIEHLFLHLARL